MPVGGLDAAAVSSSANGLAAIRARISASVVGAVEQVRVDVQRDRGAGVAENAAELRDVEPEIDDQVAGKRVAEVVIAQSRTAAVVDPGDSRGALQAATGDIAVAVRRAVGGHEHPVRAGGE